MRRTKLDCAGFVISWQPGPFGSGDIGDWRGARKA